MSTPQNTNTGPSGAVKNLVGQQRTSALVTAVVTTVFMCGVVLGICVNPDAAIHSSSRAGDASAPAGAGEAAVSANVDEGGVSADVREQGDDAMSSTNATGQASASGDARAAEGAAAGTSADSTGNPASASVRDEAEGSASSQPTEGEAGASSSAAGSEAGALAGATEGETSSSSSGDVLKEVDKATLNELSALIGEPAAESLAALATTNPDAAWIVTHLDAYAVFRDHIRAKTLTLAAEEPLACAYVRGMPEASPSDAPDYAEQAADAQGTSPTMPKSPFPHLYQWDQRWGYTYYDGDDFGMSGCGPCAIAIVYAGLTGKDDMDPYRMGQLALEGGFVAPDYGGTSDGYFTWVAERLGLTCRTIDVSADSIRSTLEAGSPIIAHVGPGTFTRVGHYFVLAGIAEDGSVIINDPYSAQRSAKLWDASVIANEALVLYAYTAV